MPSIAKGTGTGNERRYSWSDVLALRVVRELRHVGVRPKILPLVIDTIRCQSPSTAEVLPLLVATENAVCLLGLRQAFHLMDNSAVLINLPELARDITPASDQPHRKRASKKTAAA